MADEKNGPPSAQVLATAELMAHHMNAIAALFKPGMKITVLVRCPVNPERNAFLSDESDPAPVCAAITQLFTAPAKTFDV